MAAITDPPGPGRSPPPLIQVGWIRSASSTASDSPLAHPEPDGAGVGREPVDVLEFQAGIGNGCEAGVDRQRERIHHQAPSEPRAPDPRQDAPVLEALFVDRRARARADRLSDPVDRVDRTGRLEQRDPDVLLVLEADRDLLSDPDVARFTPDDVGGEVDAAILGQCHVGHRVRRREVRQPRLHVDRAPDHRGPAGHRGRFRRAACAVRTDGHRRVDQPSAVRATLDAKDAVLSRLPEPFVGGGQLGKRPHTAPLVLSQRVPISGGIATPRRGECSRRSDRGSERWTRPTERTPRACPNASGT